MIILKTLILLIVFPGIVLFYVPYEIVTSSSIATFRLGILCYTAVITWLFVVFYTNQRYRLTFDEIYFSVLNGEIIKNYPDDKPYPSCLIFWRTFGGDPVHSVWAFNDENLWAVVITVYRPDPNRWIDFRQRREKP